MIAENMLTQVDSGGFSTTILEGIINYRTSDDAISKDNMYVVTKR